MTWFTLILVLLPTVFANPFKLLHFSPDNDTYPVFNVKGTHYEIGNKIGKLGASRITTYINDYPGLSDMRTYILTAGSVNFRDMVNYNMNIYPEYFEELQGFADGSGAEYIDILLLSFENEILQLLGLGLDHNINKKCSDMLACNSNLTGIGHNEDGWNETLKTGYFVNATFINSNVSNSYFAFQYPGSLAGNAFGVNGNGLVITVNSLFPKNVSVTNSRGIYFITRQLLDCNNLTEIYNIFKEIKKDKMPISTYGVSCNIAYKNFVINIEISNNEYNIYECNNYEYHFNNYLRLLNVSSINDESSDHRLNRTLELINEFNGISSIKNIIDILGDTEDPQYPIYRDGKPPDEANTLVTGVFDMTKGEMYIFEQCNPKDCEPTLTISWL